MSASIVIDNCWCA